MGITLAGVQLMGKPFTCYISEYMRTIVYKIPDFRVQDSHLTNPIVIKDTPDFRASIVTDPYNYIKQENFLGHYGLDMAFPKYLSDIYETDANQSEKHISVVIQFKENMHSFPVVDGQCIKLEHDGIEKFAIVDCDEAPTPCPDERMYSINAVLTTIKIGFEITEGFEKLVDRQCYRTVDSKCLYRFRSESHASLTVEDPLTLEDIKAKSKPCRDLVVQIEKAIANGNMRGRQHSAFGKSLEELTEALQLDTSTDDSSLRLWYLKLWDRVEKFGRGCRPRLQLFLSNDPNNLRAEKNHRNDIAHRGVEKIDTKLLQSFQKKIFRIIKSKL